MGIPLVEGRTFDSRDTHDAPRVVIIDDFLAKRYWPDSTAIGGRIRATMGTRELQAYSVVGVVGSIKKTTLEDGEVPGLVYFPYRQLPPRNFSLAVKSAMDESDLVAPLRATIRRIDSSLPLFDLKTMGARLDESLVIRKAILSLSASLACLAVLLSAIGIYGVLAFAVAQRTREIGIRVALGAQRGDVIRMIMGYGLMLASVGLVIGLLGSQFLTDLLSSLLFGVQPTDIAVFAAVSVFLVLTALARFSHAGSSKKPPTLA
jgi:hypothetical protein